MTLEKLHYGATFIFADKPDNVIWHKSRIMGTDRIEIWGRAKWLRNATEVLQDYDEHKHRKVINVSGLIEKKIEEIRKELRNTSESTK